MAAQQRSSRSYAAAFGRLCVETSTETLGGGARKRQPPSGGCVLKLGYENGLRFFFRQPPSGGCVLKQSVVTESFSPPPQPPSGGCVLKPAMAAAAKASSVAAAFGRLCVETACKK